MKRKLSFLLLYATLVLFGGLGALLLLWGEKEPHASLTENRMLAGFPAFSLTSVRDGSFMSGLEDFLSDNMFDRDRIVTGVSRLMSGLSLGQTDEADVDEALFEQVQSFARGSEPDPDPVPAAPSATAAPIVTPEPSFPAPVEVRIAEATPAPPEPASPAETDAAEPASTESPASVPTEAPAEKDLSAVPKCVLTLTQRNGTKEVRYEFSKANVQRMIRLLNAYRAVLPEDGHVFFTQPPFPGIAANLSSGEYVGWDSDLEDAVNAFSNDGVYMLSTLQVLEQPLLAGEYLYFRTDHHWTPRAACYVANAFLRRLGVDPLPYEAYSFVTYNNFLGTAARNKPGGTVRPDTIEIMIPKTPVKGYVIGWDRSRKEAPLIYPERNSYLAYIGGTMGPWRRFDTGVDCGRSCLVIGDSYDCAFIPFLTPYYETVHATDVREDYYDYNHIRWSISDYIRENGIDDVYFILSTASGVNTDSMIYYLKRFL